ncbi:MAG: cytochrome c biogenesis CcdA family protein [Nanoarchaeota archaeon]
MVNLLTIVSLALVDAVNPCALAVMAMVLMAILLHDPKKRKDVLLGGFLFSLAVFILYFLYGLILVQFFSHLIPESTGHIANYIFKGFGIFAIVLGVLNFKDFLNYKPGGFATEMPIKFRPKVKALIKTITSPKGAFFVGLLVTLFLLPCTMGPYIIASGQISNLSFWQASKWLLFYNLIFILPMILITIIIYFGLTTVENVSGWKEKNIRYLHLIESIILISLGIAMFTGLI